MKQLRIKKEIREKIKQSASTKLLDEEENVLKQLQDPNLARFLYSHLRVLLLADSGFSFDENQKNPQTALVKRLFELGLLVDVSAGEKQKNRDFFGGAASNEALGKLKQKLCLDQKVFLKKVKVGIVSKLDLAGIKKIEELFKELTKKEKESITNDIPEETLAHILALLKKLNADTGAMRAAIVKIDGKEKNCRMVRFLVGDSDKAPAPVEAGIIISQAYAFYRNILELNRDVEKFPEKAKIEESILLNRLQDKKITFMWKSHTPYVFMLETPKILRGLIFLEMEKTMEEVLLSL